MKALIRGTFLFIALGLIFSSALMRAQSSAWQAYSYPTDGFSISTPSKPVEGKTNVPTESGNFELHTYLVVDGDAALYVGVVDYGQAAAGRDPNVMLEGSKNGAVKNVKGHVLKYASITLGTNPGLSYEAENDTMHFIARIYMVGTTLYQTLIAHPIGKPPEGTEQFLNSFQLIARTK